LSARSSFAVLGSYLSAVPGNDVQRPYDRFGGGGCFGDCDHGGVKTGPQHLGEEVDGV